MANVTFTQSINGLGTFNLFQAPSAGPYYINGSLTLPSATGGSQGTPGGAYTGSQVVCVINQNATQPYSGQVGALGFGYQATAASGDNFSVTLTSGAAVDQGLNVIRGVVSISFGLGA